MTAPRPATFRRLGNVRHAPLAVGVVVAALVHGEPRGDTILHSAHNLSTSGPGKVRAQSETDVCIFCHALPHGTNQSPMWNRYDTSAAYTPYTSSTSKASPGQPTGSSKICLSCHDGTVALGMVRSNPGNNKVPGGRIPMANGLSHMPAGPALIGRDLSDDHPISFRYDASLAQRNGELNHPTQLNKKVRLDAKGELQCTSCHDPHSSPYDKLLVMDNTRGGLCLECHDPEYWSASAHSTDSSGWNGKGENPWPRSEESTVRDNACANCHRSHGAGTPQRLLTFPSEEQNCLLCHNGNVARHNIERELHKRSAHNVFATTGVHDAAESIADTTPHVECVDCHNPHAAQSSKTGTTGLSGTLLKVPGVSSGGSVLAAIQQESELCYRCHGDNPHTGTPIISRNFQQASVRQQFLPSNTSFHPVESAGRNSDVPSLKSPLN